MRIAFGPKLAGGIGHEVLVAVLTLGACSERGRGAYENVALGLIQVDVQAQVDALLRLVALRHPPPRAQPW